MKITFSTGYAHESIISINTRTSIKVNGKSLCRVYLGTQTLAKRVFLQTRDVKLT